MISAGRRRAAWVKIGLAVRISQDLGLMTDPSPSLSNVEQEERRRLYWSVYMLDRFVSCSAQRPRSILDEDCQLRLPCGEQSFREGRREPTDTLMHMNTGQGLNTGRPGNFALVVLMGSILGRCARYTLDERQAMTHIAPWIPSSEYTIIHSMMTHFESLSEISSASFDKAVYRNYMLNGKFDQQRIGHFILQQALFHLSHCLLHHPFLLRRNMSKLTAKAPESWLSHALSLGRAHAQSLSSLFIKAKELGCIVSTSFYGYCALISGGIHALFLNSDDKAVQEESMRFLKNDIQYLEEVSRFWKNTGLIVSVYQSGIFVQNLIFNHVSGLNYFWMSSNRLKELVNPRIQTLGLDIEDLKLLWSIVDYGVMSDPRNMPSNAQKRTHSEPLEKSSLSWGGSHEEGVTPAHELALWMQQLETPSEHLAPTMGDTSDFDPTLFSSQSYEQMYGRVEGDDWVSELSRAGQQG